MTRARKACAALLAVVCWVLVVACDSRLREPAHVVTPAVRATCILIRAFTSDGVLDEVCATAEDLAPLIGEILAVHAANESKAAAESTHLPAKPEPLLAFTIPPMKRPQPKRRCVQWVSLVDAGTEGGADGGR